MYVFNYLCLRGIWTDNSHYNDLEEVKQYYKPIAEKYLGTGPIFWQLVFLNAKENRPDKSVRAVFAFAFINLHIPQIDYNGFVFRQCKNRLIVSRNAFVIVRVTNTFLGHSKPIGF